MAIDWILKRNLKETEIKASIIYASGSAHMDNGLWMEYLMLKKNQFDALVFQFEAGAAHYDPAILIKFVKSQYSTRF